MFYCFNYVATSTTTATAAETSAVLIPVSSSAILPSMFTNLSYADYSYTHCLTE